jgi:hypothetical protein
MKTLTQLFTTKTTSVRTLSKLFMDALIAVSRRQGISRGQPPAQPNFPPTETAATTVETTIEYQAEGAAVSALLFDVKYDPTVLAIEPAIGSSAEAAGKVLNSNILPAPDGQALLRILIFGINQTAIQDGTLVDLAIKVSPDAPQGAHSLQ